MLPIMRPPTLSLCDYPGNELYQSLKKLFNDFFNFCSRYYVAEGVRIYSQQSWKMIVGSEGKHMVEKYITETVSREYCA